MVMIQVHRESAQDAEKRQSSPSSGKREGYFNREHTWIGWVTVVVLILLWELLYRTGALPATSFPSAFDTFGRLFQLFGTGAFWVSVGLTMQGVVAGLGLVILIALPVGVAIGVSRFVRESTWLLIEFLKPIPPVALIPIGLLFWGPSMGMKTSLIVFGAIWPLLVQVIYGVRAVDNVVTGGAAVGQQLSGHHRVKKISFTGSSRAGQDIVRQASGNLKRVSLELGGKAASLIYPDADLSRVVPAHVTGVVNNSGQVCGALSRLYVHEDIAEEFLKQVTAAIREVKVGSGFDDLVQMGPLNSRAHFNRVSAMLDEAVGQGAKVLTGGGQPAGTPDTGFYLEPTVLSEVTDDMAIAQEEIFGPIMPILTWKDEEDLLRRVNGSQYGLGASVWTRDIGRAHSLANRIEAGCVRINTVNGLDPTTPWGGVKMSGWGREMGPESIEAYTEPKSVWVGLSY